MAELNFEEGITVGPHSTLSVAKPLTSVPNNETGESDTNGWVRNIKGGTEGEVGVNQTGWEDEFEVELDGGEQNSIIVIAAVVLIVFSLLSNMTLIMATVSKTNAEEPLCAVHLFFRHLAVAHLLLTSVFLPTLMRWINLSDFTYEGSWVTGDGACRTVAFLNNFGIYATGHVIACVTLDRCIVILRPADGCQVIRRAKIMLWIAWLWSALWSSPEAILYHVETHALATWLRECRLSGSLQSRKVELIYITTQRSFCFGVPVATIIICYALLYQKISNMDTDVHGRSIQTNMHTRAVKLSIVMAVLFIVCWTPYNIMILSYVDAMSSLFRVRVSVEGEPSPEGHSAAGSLRPSMLQSNSVLSSGLNSEGTTKLCGVNIYEEEVAHGKYLLWKNDLFFAHVEN